MIFKIVFLAPISESWEEKNYMISFLLNFFYILEVKPLPNFPLKVPHTFPPKINTKKKSKCSNKRFKRAVFLHDVFLRKIYRGPYLIFLQKGLRLCRCCKIFTLLCMFKKYIFLEFFKNTLNTIYTQNTKNSKLTEAPCSPISN